MIFLIGDKLARKGNMNKVGSLSYSIQLKGLQWVMVNYDDGSQDFGASDSFFKICGLSPKQARRILYYAIQKGEVKKQPCEVCGSVVGVHAHHDDYQKPLEVRWLCPKDHSAHHSKIRRS